MGVVAAELKSALRDIGARPGFAALVLGVAYPSLAPRRCMVIAGAWR